MKKVFNSKTPLIVIDVQKGFDEPCWGHRNNPQVEENISKLIASWRLNSRPIIHVHHSSLEKDSPLREDHPGFEAKECAKPEEGEKVFKKNVNSAFIGTGLEDYLNKLAFKTLVIVGLTTDHCVSTSVRMAGNLGYNVYLVSDASATFSKTGIDGIVYSAEHIHAVHLASLNNEFCQVFDTKTILSL